METYIIYLILKEMNFISFELNLIDLEREKFMCHMQGYKNLTLVENWFKIRFMAIVGYSRQIAFLKC